MQTEHGGMKHTESTIKQHRWSGWPGAWCLDCGVEDPVESALGCPNCDLRCFDGDTASDEMCTEHKAYAQAVKNCPEPNSHRFDPYYKAKTHKGYVWCEVDLTHRAGRCYSDGPNGERIPSCTCK